MQMMCMIAQYTGGLVCLGSFSSFWFPSTTSRQDSRGVSSYCFSLPMPAKPNIASILATAGAAILTQTGKDQWILYKINFQHFLCQYPLKIALNGRSNWLGALESTDSWNVIRMLLELWGPGGGGGGVGQPSPSLLFIPAQHTQPDTESHPSAPQQPIHSSPRGSITGPSSLKSFFARDKFSRLISDLPLAPVSPLRPAIIGSASHRLPRLECPRNGRAGWSSVLTWGRPRCCLSFTVVVSPNTQCAQT